MNVICKTAGSRVSAAAYEEMSMTPLPHSFKRIRLELARSKEYPNGAANRGYEFVAPLDSAGHIDPILWHKHRQQCRVHRFWGDDEEAGSVVHKPGGSEYARWLLAYDDASDHGSEAGYRFGKHSFDLGEYVSISDQSGDSHTFRVVSVEPAAA
jgi:hypothetical protein